LSRREALPQMPPQDVIDRIGSLSKGLTHVALLFPPNQSLSSSSNHLMIASMCSWLTTCGCDIVSVYRPQGFAADEASAIRSALAEGVTVHLLSREMCEGDFVNRVLPQLSKEYDGGALELQDISVEHIKSRLCVQLPDPELALMFDSNVRHGFLPWHIRTTEFFQMPSLCNMSFDAFEQAMHQWSHVEQRFGK